MLLLHFLQVVLNCRLTEEKENSCHINHDVNNKIFSQSFKFHDTLNVYKKQNYSNQFNLNDSITIKEADNPSFYKQNSPEIDEFNSFVISEMEKNIQKLHSKIIDLEKSYSNKISSNKKPQDLYDNENNKPLKKELIKLKPSKKYNLRKFRLEIPENSSSETRFIEIN